jgi:hypothetical protein
MKGFLTFTLAAGVAITTTSIAQAAGVGKGAMNADRTASTQTQAPMSVGAMGGLILDRTALNRELSRLSVLLEPTDGDEEGGSANMPVQNKTMGTWTGW